MPATMKQPAAAKPVAKQVTKKPAAAKQVAKKPAAKEAIEKPTAKHVAKKPDGVAIMGTAFQGMMASRVRYQCVVCGDLFPPEDVVTELWGTPDLLPFRYCEECYAGAASERAYSTR